MLQKVLMVVGALVLALLFGKWLNSWSPEDASLAFQSPDAGFSVKSAARLQQSDGVTDSYYGMFRTLDYRGQANGLEYRIEAIPNASLADARRPVARIAETSLLFEPLPGRLSTVDKAHVLSPDGRSILSSVHRGRLAAYRLQVTLPRDPSYDQRLYAGRFLDSFDFEGR